MEANKVNILFQYGAFIPNFVFTLLRKISAVKIKKVFEKSRFFYLSMWLVWYRQSIQLSLKAIALYSWHFITVLIKTIVSSSKTFMHLYQWYRLSRKALMY